MLVPGPLVSQDVEPINHLPNPGGTIRDWGEVLYVHAAEVGTDNPIVGITQ